MTLLEVHQRTGELLKEVFEHTETNVDEVRRDGPNAIEFVGATNAREIERMQDRINILEGDLSAEELEAQIERLHEELAEANELISELSST